uniref:Si:dkey-81h8.1 n=1 Tax=Myripristis murdjan TaxID=586833 RepID=A0A667XIT4_9TELE
MGIDSMGPRTVVGSLSPGQLESYQRMEPKTLGAIQIIIGALILCLSASVLQIHEVHFTGDVALFLIVLLIHCRLFHGRSPSLFWVSLSLSQWQAQAV